MMAQVKYLEGCTIYKCLPIKSIVHFFQSEAQQKETSEGLNPASTEIIEYSHDDDIMNKFWKYLLEIMRPTLA